VIVVRIKIESKGGFDKALQWMNKVSNVKPEVFRDLAQRGTTSLGSTTPEDTGETASGWKHDVKVGQNSLEIAWTNVAHPESEVNVAKLIELGHGTRTGGYVQPRPYIKKAMAPVWNKLDKDIRELMK
jgi:hypothetical protein